MHRQHRADTGPQYRGDHRFDEQRGDHGLARYTVGCEHAEFARAVRDGAGGGHRHLYDTDEEHGYRDQHDGATDLVGVAQRRGLGRMPSDMPNTITTRNAPVAVVTTGNTISPMRRRAESQP